jgi:ComF family protein
MLKVNNWLNFHLFRSTCWLCHAPLSRDQPLCPTCLVNLPANRHACQTCALPVSNDQRICGHCLAKAPAYQSSLIPYIYARPIDRLITTLKFRHRLQYARLLGELLADCLPETRMSGLDALLPVPLHRQRLRERGFNQSLEIARFVAGRFQLPILTRGCHRVRATAAQSELPLKQRRSNLRAAFDIRLDLDGMAIGIVDDVVTSGHTADELSRSLLRAGAGPITVIAVARADFRK